MKEGVISLMFGAALHGFLLAMPLIVPLGVQNIFVFNQGALQPKFVRTLPVVITASICDTLLISLAVKGVSKVVLNYFWLKSLMYGLGVLFLAFMGWNTWRSVPNFDLNKNSEAFAASVSLLNPHAIVDTVVVIGANSLQYEGWNKLAFPWLVSRCLGYGFSLWHLPGKPWVHWTKLGI